jgi:pimeloyl-ACP methyl ester carboxylesterase
VTRAADVTNMPKIGRLRYLDAPPAGTGRRRGTLVLLHAFPLNADMWRPQLSLAEGGWRVVAPHLRGMDGGDTDPSAASMDDYAGDVIDLLDALHIEDAVFGGLSMGGYLAFALFRHAPQYFRGLLLSDTRSEADTPEAVEGRRRLLALLNEKGPRAVADEMVPKLLGPDARSRPEVVDQVRQLILANGTTAIAGAITALMTRQDSTPLLSSIHCPTLVLVGEQDTLTPPDLSRALEQKIAGAELTIIRRAGHLASLEEPEAWNAQVARFLEHRV